MCTIFVFYHTCSTYCMCTRLRTFCPCCVCKVCHTGQHHSREQDNLSSLLQQRARAIFSFSPNQQNNERKAFVFSLLLLYWLKRFDIQDYKLLFIAICYLPHLFQWGFKFLPYASNFGRRLCFFTYALPVGVLISKASQIWLIQIVTWPKLWPDGDW